ncbi:VOC family protein [Natrarchaeobius oligotrophus]|uniref:Glyoxalase-like domain-containing protein n=1 Tax=Natrarchaeobius chitinivorans TaxID=1679083 RepID=A0A3N6MFX2_NATCH|nr:VOC family protein [Natrarchaeobius chitinivorans]RQH01848.1 hypothetical protein EA472_05930 [Natrarchaeobius chitinivorans]
MTSNDVTDMMDIHYVNFACRNPDELAAFWAQALEGEPQRVNDEIVVVERTGGSPSLMFREAPRGTDRDLPIHLDFAVDERTDAVERSRNSARAPARRRRSKTTATNSPGP